MDNMESEWVFVLRHLSETTLSNLEVFSLEAEFDSAGEKMVGVERSVHSSAAPLLAMKG